MPSTRSGASSDQKNDSRKFEDGEKEGTSMETQNNDSVNAISPTSRELQSSYVSVPEQVKRLETLVVSSAFSTSAIKRES